MAKRTDRETEQKIIEYYNQGYSMKDTAKKFNTTSATVLRILNSYNIPKRTKGGIYKIPDEEVIQRYKSGESCQSIADSYKVTFHTISNILEKNQIKRDNIYYNLELDRDYFLNINSYDKAYFLGFLISDGYVALDSNTISLTLAAKDVEILNIFKEKTKNTNLLYERLDEKHHEYSFRVKSKEWKDQLQQYGVIPQKTGKEYIPPIDDKYMPHLIRGLIDGDGWISSKSHQIGFCGNEKIVNQLKDYLVNKLNIYDVKVLHTEEKLWQITWASNKDISLIGNFIYQDKNDCFLKRKFLEFQKIQGNTEVNN